MSQCMNDNELDALSRSVWADGRDINMMSPRRNNLEADVTADMMDFAERRAKDKQVDSIAAEMPEDPTPAPDNDSRTNQAVTQAANKLQRWSAESSKWWQDNLKKWENDITRFGGTSYNEASKWLNFVNGTFRIFQDKAAKLYKFGQVFAGTDAQNVNNNPFISALLKGQRTHNGLNQQFLNWMTELYANPLRQVADSLGKDVRELMTMVGHYASARHAMERNPILRDRWEGELLAEQQRANPDAERIKELETNIANYDQYIDAENPPPEVAHAGYTNWQAEKQMKSIEKNTGMTKEQLEAAADNLCAVYQRIQDFRAKNGLLGNAKDFPEFNDKHYVPLLLEKDNLAYAVNDTHIYNPRRFYRFDGTTGMPDSAFTSILNYMKRTASEVAYEDTGRAMVIMAQKSFGKDIRYSDIPINTEVPAENGLRMVDYDKSIAIMNHGDDFGKRVTNAYMNSDRGGGLVVKVPKINRETGETEGYRRVFVQWDPNWVDEANGLTGAELNSALMHNTRKGSDLNMIAKATGFMGQFYTRLNPLFSPVNTVRDTIERGSNLMGMELFGENGERINGSSIVTRYMATLPEAAHLMREWKYGRLEEGSAAWQMVQDYIEDGLHQEYTRGVNVQRVGARDLFADEVKRKRTSDILNDPKYAGVKKAVKAMGAQGAKALEVLDEQWNDVFNNIAPLAEYMAMRKAGVARNSAANAVLSQMNLYQSGTATKLLQSFFPFVKPSVQSFTAAMRTLGATDASGHFRLNKRGIAGVIGMAGAYMLLSQLSRSSLGTDPETGIDRFDQLSIDELQRGLPIGIDGGKAFLRFPTGYGLIQPIIAMVVGADRVYRGLGTAEEATFDTMFSMVKNAMPANWPQFRFSDHPLEWIAQAFTPTLGQPIVESAFRLDRYGRPITYADPNGPKAMALQGGKNVPKRYHDTAKDILKYFGADFAPEQIRSLANGLLIGPARLFKGIIEDSPMARASRSESASQTLGPVWTALGASLLYGNTYDTGKAMFYNALDAFNRRIRKSGIEITSKEYGSDRDKKEAFLRERLPQAGFSAQDIEDYLRLDRAMADIRKYNRTSSDIIMPLWQEEDSGPLKEALEGYARDTGAMYDAAVNGLNFYKGIRR